MKQSKVQTLKSAFVIKSKLGFYVMKMSKLEEAADKKVYWTWDIKKAKSSKNERAMTDFIKKHELRDCVVFRMGSPDDLIRIRGGAAMMKKFSDGPLFQAWIRTLDPKAVVTVGFNSLAAEEWERRESLKGCALIAYTYSWGTGRYQAFVRDPLTGKPFRFEKPNGSMRRPLSKEAIKHD